MPRAYPEVKSPSGLRAWFIFTPGCGGAFDRHHIQVMIAGAKKRESEIARLSGDTTPSFRWIDDRHLEVAVAIWEPSLRYKEKVGLTLFSLKLEKWNDVQITYRVVPSRDPLPDIRREKKLQGQ